MNSIILFLDLIFLGYTIYVFPTIILYLTVKSKRRFILRFIEISNLIILVATALYLLIFILKVLAFGIFHEESDFTVPLKHFFDESALSFWLIFLAKGLIGQLFWINRIRKNIWSSLFAFPFLLVDHYCITFLNITGSNRDYFPTSPIIYLPSLIEILFAVFIFTSILVVCYIIFRKKNFN